MSRVYFIKPIGMTGPIKIGCSASPARRRRALETWSPFPLEIIAEIEGDYQLERRFHTLFAHLHERREWFVASPEIYGVVDAIEKGSFDIATLPPGKRIDNRGLVRPPWFSKQMSYSLRTAHMQRRTGYRCPVSVYNMVAKGDQERIAAVERYLANPIAHGVRMPWADKSSPEPQADAA